LQDLYLDYNRLPPNAPKTIRALQQQWKDMPITKSARNRGTMIVGDPERIGSTV
jgi:hypothetical protein